MRRKFFKVTKIKGGKRIFNKSILKPGQFDWKKIMLSQRFAHNMSYILPFQRRYLSLEEINSDICLGCIPNKMSIIERKYFNLLKIVAQNTLQYLEKNGVDFSSKNYIFNKSFKEINQELVFPRLFSRLTLGWVVECYALSPKRLEQVHGTYGMGINRCFTSEELNRKNFLKYIFDNTQRYDSPQTNIYRDISKKDSDLYRYFFRKEKNNKLGLYYRLKNENVIDLDYFTPQNNDLTIDENVLKLLAMFYDIERGNNILITAFWRKPSLENLDLTSTNTPTYNQSITVKIKSELAKEISIYYCESLSYAIRQINGKLSNIIKLFNYFCWDAGKNIRLNDNQVERIIKSFKEFNSILDFNINGILAPYKDNLFRTMYLKILEHEMIGKMIDLKEFNNKDALKICQKAYPPKLKDYLDALNGTIRKDLIKEYLLQNKDEIIYSLFEGSVFNDATPKKIFHILKKSKPDNHTIKSGRSYILSKTYWHGFDEKASANIFKKAIDVFYQYLEIIEDISPSSIKGEEISIKKAMIIFISCVEIITSDEEIKPNFYHATKSDKRTYRAELKRGLKSNPSNQFRFTRIFLENLWKMNPIAINQKKRELIIEFENIIYEVEEKVFSANNIYAMKFLENIYLFFFENILSGFLYYEEYFDKFNNELYDGYSVLCTSKEKCFELFLALNEYFKTFEGKYISLDLNEKIKNRENVCLIEMPTKVSIGSEMYCLKYKFIFHISHVNKTIKMTDFKIEKIENNNLPLYFLEKFLE